MRLITYWFPLDFNGVTKEQILQRVGKAIDQRIALSALELGVPKGTPANLNLRLSGFLDDRMQLITVTFEVPDNAT